MIRRLCFSAILVVICGNLVAQKDSIEAPIFTMVERMPEFAGGKGALMKYLVNNLSYPESAMEHGYEGVVYTQFIIEKNGAVSSVETIRPISPALDAEAIRVISGMPNWTPGLQRGKPVRVKYVLPLRFQLDKKTKRKLKRTKRKEAKS